MKHDTQQVCIKGHKITDGYNNRPEQRKKFCDKCGAETIHKCPVCDFPIEGNDMELFFAVPVPDYCPDCGEPYPWAVDRQENDGITRELLNETVNRYLENGDFETARNYIKSWGEVIEGFNVEEELKKFDDGKYLPGFWSLIHHDVIRVSKRKFEDGHYTDSVESAFKEVNHRVKILYKDKIGEEDDGQSLMFKAFGFQYNKNRRAVVREPPILLASLNSESGRNIQDGYKYIFGGSMTAIRNPKAHENINITKEEAIHSLFLASKLMRRLDESR